jgi:hypothetical protein
MRSTGKSICALVDALRPGLIPKWRDLDSKNALQNATTVRACPRVVAPMNCLLRHAVLSSSLPLTVWIFVVGQGITTAEEQMGVAKLVYPDEMVQQAAQAASSPCASCA